jgi:hypothetical protein
METHREPLDTGFHANSSQIHLLGDAAGTAERACEKELFAPRSR